MLQLDMFLDRLVPDALYKAILLGGGKAYTKPKIVDQLYIYLKIEGIYTLV